MTLVVKPIYVNLLDGRQYRTPDGAITNIGGTDQSTFTVGGRGLLFDDGSSTGGGTGNSSFSLQVAYNNSTSPSGAAPINMTPGKNLVIGNVSGTTTYFSINATTGDVTIPGNLLVQGQTYQVDSVIQNLDLLVISQAGSGVTPLEINPDAGVTPLVDLFIVRNSHNGAPVIRIDRNGALFATDATFSGLVNGYNLTTTLGNLVDHANPTGGGIKHMATNISVANTLSHAPNPTDLQDALQKLDAAITSSSSSVMGYEHIQVTASMTWTVAHNHNTNRIQWSIYDASNRAIMPDDVLILNTNTVVVTFTEPVAGRAVLVMF
jgi:hypothetical protein